MTFGDDLEKYRLLYDQTVRTKLRGCPAKDGWGTSSAGFVLVITHPVSSVDLSVGKTPLENPRLPVELR